MNDAGQPIEIDISSNVISVFEEGQGNYRFLLGHVLGEFYEIPAESELFVTAYFKRNIDMAWENVTFELNPGEKVFKAKLPAGLLVVSYFMRLFGWVNDEFEVTDLKISRKALPVGKYGGKPIKLLDEILSPPPPDFTEAFTPFLIKIPQVGDIQPSSVTVVWATTHKATSKVIYGEDPEEMTNVVEDVDFVDYHELPIDGLDIEKKYYCQIYSTSEKTGKEIHSDILEFTTGKEITITVDNISNLAELLNFTQKNLSIGNYFNTALEKTLTTTPDIDDDFSNEAAFDIKTKTDLEVQNTIGTEYDCEVT